MAPDIPDLEPSRLVAGDTWQWTRQDHPEFSIASGWTLSYLILGPVNLTWLPAWITQDGSTWTITIPADKTAVLETRADGARYRWSAVMTGSGTYAGWRRVIKQGDFLIFPDPATAGEGDFQSQAERDLDAVNAVLSGRITADIEEYTIGGRSVRKMALAELLKLRTQLEARVWRQQHPGQIGPAIAFRFAGRP